MPHVSSYMVHQHITTSLHTVTGLCSHADRPHSSGRTSTSLPALYRLACTGSATELHMCNCAAIQMTHMHKAVPTVDLYKACVATELMAIHRCSTALRFPVQSSRHELRQHQTTWPLAVQTISTASVAQVSSCADQRRL